MNFKHNIIRKFPFIAQLNGCKHIFKTLKKTSNINRVFKHSSIQDGTIYLDKKTKDIFRKSFIKLIWAQPNDYDIALMFMRSVIIPLSRNINLSNINENDPILICIVKNDLDRIKMSIEHYKKMGIKNFVYIDNMSTDGTLQYLLSQSNFDVYKCETPYTTKNREAWINRIIAYYGFDKWYLCVDSDELFVYQEMENVKIDKYIEGLRHKKQRRVLSFLLDMYSKKNLFQDDITSENIRNEYCYFDKDSYIKSFNYKMDIIKGGPRQRVFFEKSNNNFMLTKYPLFYFIKGDLQCCSHYQYPYKANYNLKCNTALLHFKFLKSDLDKYIERAKNENYANGSLEYKNYIDLYNRGKIINLYNDKSVKFENSKSLSLIETIYEEE